MKKITILTSCLNPISVDLLNSLQNSIVRSSIEWILIDGGTEEEKYPILNQIRQESDVFVVVPKSSIYEALNVGFEYASAPWIWVMGLDDSISSCGAIERLINHLQVLDGGVFWCVGGVAQMSWLSGGRRIFMPNDNSEGMPAQMSGVMAISHQSILVRTSVLSTRYRFEPKFKFAADYHLILRLMQSGGKGSAFPEVLAIVGSKGVSNKPQNAFRVFLEYYLIRREIFGKNYPSRYWVKNLLKVVGRIAFHFLVKCQLK